MHARLTSVGMPCQYKRIILCVKTDAQAAVRKVSLTTGLERADDRRAYFARRAR